MMRWLNTNLVMAMHHESIREHGGAAGIRDPLLLESALSRPRNQFEYEGADMHQLAAAYAFGICRNHPFVDGNKRTSLAALGIFLELNGYALTAPEPDAALTILELAQGTLAEPELAEWIKANSEPLA